MTISSIHFQKAEVEFAEKHNFRTEKKEPEYLLDKQYRKTNEYLKLHDPKELYQEQMELRKQNHSRGFAPHLKDVYWEAVVNLDEKHSLADVKKVADFIQQKYHLQPCSIALHHDEGYTDKDGTVKYNHHAHLCFLTMDNGISTMRKIRSKELRQMQTEVAQLLGLERGKEHSQAMRLNHQQYRAVMKAQEELTRENVKELNVFYNQKLNNKISELQSTLIKPLLTLSKKLTDEKAELETEKQTLTTQLEAEKKNIKTVTKTVTVTRDLTDDEIELLPKVSELKKKLTESETALSEAPVKTQKELNELKSKIRQEMIEQGGFSAQDYRALNQLITDYKNAFKLGETVTVSEVIEDIYQRLKSTVKLKEDNNRLTTENADLQKKVETLTQAQSQKELQRQSATVTVHNFEHKDSTVKLKDRYKVHSIIGDIDSRTETIIKNIRESDALGTQQQPLGREYYRTHMDSSDYNDIISKIDREHSKTRTERQNTQSMSNPTQIKKKSTYERF